MSILDEKLRFSKGQSITADSDSTDQLDLVEANPEPGTGKTLNIEVLVPDFAGAGSFTVGAQTSDTKGGTFTTVQALGTINATTKKLVAKIDPEKITKRFLKLRYDVTGAVTKATINAHIVVDTDLYRSYPVGYKVTG